MEITTSISHLLVTTVLSYHCHFNFSPRFEWKLLNTIENSGIEKSRIKLFSEVFSTWLRQKEACGGAAMVHA